MNRWPHLEVEVKDPHFSDHSLLCVTMEEVQTRSPKPFKLLNHLAGHIEFQHIVADTWASTVHGSPIERTWKKFKLMKGAMKTYVEY